MITHAQCEIIHGLFVGNIFDPSGAFTALLFPVLQQLQPAPWRLPTSADVRGACALRSLVAWAIRDAAGTVENAGADSNARGAKLPQPGHGCGSRYSDSGRAAAKPPQSAQAYS